MKQIKMGRTGNLILLAAMILCGCGGGGDDEDEKAGSAPPENPPAAASAPAEIREQRLSLISSDGSNRELQFLDESSWAALTGEGNGTYSYTRDEGGSTALLILTQGTEEERLSLSFSTSKAGSFSDLANGAEQGTFTLTAIEDSSGGAGLGEEPGENPDSEVSPPQSLAGKVMFGTRTFTSTGPVGQTHVYTFDSNSFHDSDPPEESDGNYVYELHGNRAILILNYNFPKDFDGDRHEIEMEFNAVSSGTFTSLYTRRDGTVIQINGDFEIQ